MALCILHHLTQFRFVFGTPSWQESNFSNNSVQVLVK